MESLGTNRSCQFSVHIAPWTHFRGRPVGKAAVVHGEAVVMLEDRNDVLRSGFLEETRPSCGIEMLRPEHWDEILVTKLCQRAISAKVVVVFVRALTVHIARIPFASKRRH